MLVVSHAIPYLHHLRNPMFWQEKPSTIAPYQFLGDLKMRFFPGQLDFLIVHPSNNKGIGTILGQLSGLLVDLHRLRQELQIAWGLLSQESIDLYICRV